MYVLAINGSPHGSFGNTDLVLQNILKGMKSTGATIETVYLNKQNIKLCIGCNACWFKTPGQCIHHDDMASLLNKLDKADLLIYATPLYVFSMTGLMKNFLDRTIPNVLPFFIENTEGNKLTTHPRRNPRTTKQKMLLVGSCAFPEEVNFASAVQTFKYIAEVNNINYLGEIIKTASGLLRTESMRDKVAAYCDDLFIAGKELLLQGKIDKELTKRLRQPWLSDQDLRNIVNQRFLSVLNDK